MGKEYEIKKVEMMRRVLKSVTCDDCGASCKNTHFDVLTRGSFCDDSDLIKTVCFDCWEKQYKKAIKRA